VRFLQRLVGKSYKTDTMRKISLLLLSILTACNSHTDKSDGQQVKAITLNPMPEIETINYLDINNQVQQILQENNGSFPIMVFKKTKGLKQLIYLGEQHGNDPTDKRFDTIQKYFSLLSPAIILNEGGQVSDSIHFKTRDEAIQKKGTIGFLKFLADNAKVKLQNADCPDSLELSSLLKKYDRNKILYFLVIQRFIPQYIAGYNGAKNLTEEYKKFTEKYLTQRCMFTLTEQESKWSHFENLYKQNNGNKSIDLKSFDLGQTEFDGGAFGEILRSSLHTRDSVILTNIYNSFKVHDKVFIVFGAAHLLAQKRTLNQMFDDNTTKR
jgi:hypothetical protein